MKKSDKKSQYCGQFETELLKINTSYSGKIDWQTIIFFYFSGVSIDEAVERYIVSHPMV